MWIVTTNLDKPKGKERKDIRRHVMRGKNTRGARRHRNLVHLMDAEGAQWSNRVSYLHQRDAGDVRDWVPAAPRKIASELALGGIAVDLKPYMVHLIYRAFTIIKPSTFTLEQTLTGYPQNDMFCFKNVAEHPALFHSVLYAAQAWHDASTQSPPSPVCLYHLTQTLRLIQQSLANINTQMLKSTMAAIVSLATASIFLNDTKTAMKHMNGLHHLIHLRGGLDSLGPGSMIEHKAQRIDFGLALATGNSTRFFREQTWGPHIAADSAARYPELAHIPLPDPRLLNVWADLREFSKTANQCTQDGVKMSPTFFTRLTETVPWRLTLLEFEIESASELLRLCMLAFTKSLVVQAPGFGKAMLWLAARIKLVLCRQHDARMADVFLWACFVSAISVFEDFDRDWIREKMTAQLKIIGAKNWEETRKVLKRFPWADLVFDGPACSLYNNWIGKASMSRPQTP